MIYLKYDPYTYKLNVHHGDGIITEGWMRDLYRMGADAKETILNAYVITKDWVVKVNALGTPTRRLMGCVVIMRNETSSKCKWEGFTIAQDYAGNNSYGNTYCVGNNQRIYPVKCEYVNKY